MRMNSQQMYSRNAGNTLTPQQKGVAVNRQYGNKSIGNQQGTSRQLYDTLPLDATTNLEFFKTCQTRVFPRTNLSQGKLQVGETITVTRIYFTVINFSASTGIVTTGVTLTVAGLAQLYASQFAIQFDTVLVSKPVSLVSQNPSFNKNARHATNEWMLFDNEPVVITDIQFQVNLQTPVYTAVSNSELRCTMEGWGTIFSPKGQF